MEDVARGRREEKGAAELRRQDFVEPVTLYVPERLGRQDFVEARALCVL